MTYLEILKNEVSTWEEFQWRGNTAGRQIRRKGGIEKVSEKDAEKYCKMLGLLAKAIEKPEYDPDWIEKLHKKVGAVMLEPIKDTSESRISIEEIERRDEEEDHA